MNASLRTLLTGVVDYAGLFPPAKLPLDQALRNYARYRQEAEAWMLGRFVIPALRLPELNACANLFQGKEPFALSVLGQGGETFGLFMTGTTADHEQIRAFLEHHSSRFSVDAFEVRPPAEFRPMAVGFLTQTFGRDRPALFIEIPPPSQKNSSALDVSSPRRTGLKLRTGGLEASAFPTTEQVAFVLHACREAGVPLKFTAGLHHPLRRYDAGVQTHMHGFINVFVAGVLAHARHLHEDALRAVIADEDAADFVFTDDGLRWRDIYASTSEIVLARRDFVTSFGSCSFDEPRDDLRALGWL